MGSCDSYDSYHSDSVGVRSLFGDIDDISDNETERSSCMNRINYEFGNFQDTRDWIECESTRFSGKIYFFNLRTHCSTWTRPISRHVQLRRYHPKSSPYCNNLPCDNSLMIISSEDEEEDEDEDDGYMEHGTSALSLKKGGRRTKMSYKNCEILARLYYGVDVTSYSTDGASKYFEDRFYEYPKESFYEENRSDYKNKFLHEKVADSLVKTNGFEEKQCFKAYKHETINSSIPTSDFLQVELTESENIFKIPEINGRSSNDYDLSSVEEKRIEYSTSDEDDADADGPQEHSVPRLKRMKSKYLLKNSKRKRGSLKKKVSPIDKKMEPKKIVCNMYGTISTNYDPIEPELPPGVKRTTLSESTVTSLSWQRHISSTPNNNFDFFNLNFNPKNLSSESSSSSSSSSSLSSNSSSCSNSNCSCCSSSSSSSNSSNTTN